MLRFLFLFSILISHVLCSVFQKREIPEKATPSQNITTQPEAEIVTPVPTASPQYIGVNLNLPGRPNLLEFNGTKGEQTLSYAWTRPKSHSQSSCATTTEDFFKEGLNITTRAPPTPTCRHNCSCVGECNFFPRSLFEVSWSSYTPAKTITAATVFHVVYNGTGYTSTSTKYNFNALGRKLQDVNAGGTTQTTITFGDKLNALSSTVLVYPTPLLRYDSVYFVSGPIKTTDAANGQSTCISIESDFDDGAPFTLPSKSFPPQNIAGGLKELEDLRNPRGFGMAPVINAGGDSDFFRTAYPGQLAFQSCALVTPTMPGLIGVERAFQSAAYLTETSTLHTNAALPPEVSSGSSHESTAETTSSVFTISPVPTIGHSTNPTGRPTAPAHSPPDVSVDTIARTTNPLASPNKDGSNAGDAPPASSFANPIASIVPGIAESKDNSRASPTGGFTNPAMTIVPMILGDESSGNIDSFEASAPPQETSSPFYESPAPTPQAASLGRFVSSEQSSPVASIVAGSATILVVTSATPSTIAGRSTNVQVFGLESSTIALGQTAVISNTPVVFISSAGRTHAVVGGFTTPLVAPAYSTRLVGHPILQAAGEIATPDSQGRYVIAEQTLAPGSSIVVPGTSGMTPTTVALLTNSKGQTAVVVNGKSSVLAAASAPSGRTLSPGLPAVAGTNGGPATAIALQTKSVGETAVTLNSQASILTPSTPITAAPLIIGSETLLPNSGGSYIISGQNLIVGSAITIPGSSPDAPSITIALTVDAHGHTEAVINGQTTSLIPAAITAAPLILSPGGETLLPNAAGDYLIDGSTLLLGSSITVHGTSPGAPRTIIALTTDSQGHTEAIINGRTSLLTPLTASASPSGEPIIVVDGQTIRPDARGEYLVDGKRLSLDGEITLGDGASATTIVLTTDAAGQMEAVFDGKTSLLSTMSASGGTTGSTGMGNYIMSGLPEAAPPSGASRGIGIGGWIVGLGVGGVVGVLAVVL